LCTQTCASVENSSSSSLDDPVILHAFAFGTIDMDHRQVKEEIKIEVSNSVASGSSVKSD
jgi:hypothetical protein